MNKPDIHLIALDLDGTLLPRKNSSPRNLAALTRAAELELKSCPRPGGFTAVCRILSARPVSALCPDDQRRAGLRRAKLRPIYRAEIPWQDAVSLLRYLDKWGRHI